MKVCIVNIGPYRTGSTTLAECAKDLGWEVHREFPILRAEQYRDFLYNPETAVSEYFSSTDGMKQLLEIVKTNDLVGDGWFSLLPHAPLWLHNLDEEAMHQGIQLKFVATVRDAREIVQSELQHWVRHGLERKAGLDHKEREKLRADLELRTFAHLRSLQKLKSEGIVTLLELEKAGNAWPKELAKISRFSEKEWDNALKKVGKQNSNPSLPIEGILLTMRVGSGSQSDGVVASVQRLLDELEQDSLCRYLVVVAIDADEQSNEGTRDLLRRLESRVQSREQMKSFHLIINNNTPPGSQPFALCNIWERMAIKAWEEGADWVVLLGDDIRVQCPYHYRAIYRTFLEISERLMVPFGFGCPWWNDITFPGFPTFPCIGKAHYEIFGRLIPAHRESLFVNQDLDPYLQCLYLKFKAAPRVSEAILVNEVGGNVGAGEARYQREEATGWRDFVWEDIDPIHEYVRGFNQNASEALVLDVIVPSYRVRLEYLEPICSLVVPDYLCVQFIIIVDNVDKLLQVATSLSQAENLSIHEAERVLEDHLSTNNNLVRVRCNRVNRGASASRNRGLDESAAEFFLNLDDDLVPNPDLLEQYGQQLLEHASDATVVGFIGLVKFPRSEYLPLKHAAVLMSYLTFMFEIAEREDMYEHPAWGVTANILFRRTPVRFDEAYAKTGGGEDVDFSLRVAGTEGKLFRVPRACVVHPFWEGSILHLGSHFFNWAVGDGGLLSRFPEYRYWSFPDMSETLFLLIPMAVLSGCPEKLLVWIPAFVLVDVTVDCSNKDEFRHRCSLLKHERSQRFYLASHILANIYVIILESGRLWGHIKRINLSCVCHRFDWHCGRLPNAPRNFRMREALKFAGFTILVGLVEVFKTNSVILRILEHLGPNNTCPAI